MDKINMKEPVKVFVLEDKKWKINHWLYF
jgi:hypothetical protein